jgi:hypothetical protein
VAKVSGLDRGVKERVHWWIRWQISFSLNESISGSFDHNFLPEWYRSGIQLQPEAL